MDFNEPMPPRKMDKRVLWLFILSGVILVGFSGLCGYVLGTEYRAGTNTQKNTKTSAASTTVQNTSADNSKVGITVQWQEPVEISDLGLINKDSEITNATYYRIGTFSDASSSGDVVLLTAMIPWGIPGQINAHYVFLRNSSQLTLLKKYSDDIPSKGDYAGMDSYQLPSDGLNKSMFIIDDKTKISDLEFPKELQTSNPRQTAELDSIIVATDTPPLDLKIQLPLGKLYSTLGGAIYMKGNAPLVGQYVSKPDFYNQDGMVPQITWNDGTKNTTEYNYSDVGGCGSTDYLSVVDPKDVSVSTDLVLAGTNNQGDPIYVLKNTDHIWLKNLYNSYGKSMNLSYQQFLARRPLLYWVDPFGRLIELQNAKFAPQAECGKPVIYLYPKEKTVVSVKVEPQGGMTYSDPAYNGGWTVEASPNGHLKQVSTGREYPYLFWEGRGGIYEQPKHGWVVRQTAVKGFLTARLHQLGLNHDEIADFLDFWLPKMQGKPYYFVTFVGNSVMDTLAPLTVDPKPDTVIRILMDYTPLDKPIKATGYTIHTPKRNGFTVVEWGGVLRGNN